MRILRPKHAARTVAALALAGIATSACGFGGTNSSSRTRYLDDRDDDGLLEEVVVDANAEGCVIMPEPGDCPVMEWTETHTVTTDASGNVISESWQVCTQCFEEDGTTPIGDEVCTDQPPVPPDVWCEEYPGMDPNSVCYVCIAPDGTVVEDSCYPLPVDCESDADCPDGQVCYPGWGQPPGEPECKDTDGDGMIDVCEDFPGMGGGSGGGGGTCGYPDPCQPVPSLPEDPTGESCWKCVDPATGQDLGGWCDVHTCQADGSCANPWEVCDPASGYCVWQDPCQPVPSLPEDPTGQDCWICDYPEDPGFPPPPPGDPSDPMDPNGDGQVPGGMGGSYGWCNLHTCNSDADCAPLGETCNESTGYCEWVDPCVPVPSLPEFPGGFDCYQCTDPATGQDWGGWCNGATCSSDSDCLNTMAGDTCVEGVCVWNGGCGDPGFPGDPGQPPPPPDMPYPLPPGGMR